MVEKCNAAFRINSDAFSFSSLWWESSQGTGTHKKLFMYGHLDKLNEISNVPSFIKNENAEWRS